ncbi:hypothetical protein BM221_003231 [Beauveria bassiana]|uniref:Uncharacterized protein n=1 Tax=Beauveria bassiana TaxID=176275 RepID=A0A2N6NU30_BEABA|nr:hypothetical protein BM221_003231 [Beauveria bassiana]
MLPAFASLPRPSPPLVYNDDEPRRNTMDVLISFSDVDIVSTTLACAADPRRSAKLYCELGLCQDFSQQRGSSRFDHD